MAEVIIGLGSNIGDRQAMLKQARDELAELLDGMVASSIYESVALLTDDAPDEWNKPFLNQVVKGDAMLEPMDLLTECQRIERAMGKKVEGYWAPRCIDIDILSHGQYVMDTPTLTLPHQEMLSRDFVMIPLVEIAPYWSYPVVDDFGVMAHDVVREKGFRLGEGLKKLEDEQAA